MVRNLCMRITSSLALGTFFFSLALVGAACSSSRESFPGDDKPDAGNLGPALNGDASTTVSVTFSGTIYAPNGTLPMANALFYVTAKEPEAIPEGAYCDQCVTLPDDTFGVSGADGAFEFTAKMPAGKAWIVTQKGQFRRVREVEIKKEETIKVDKDDSTLPGRSSPSEGDTIPKMAVLKDASDYDHIYESLNKLGIYDFVTSDRNMLSDGDEVMKYQVLFVPCGSKADPLSANAGIKANLQKFVQSGGKLYVTDWSYEFVRQPFPNFLNWEGATSTLGSGASGAEWDAPATATDQGLADWLAATGDTSFEVKGNWTTINAINTVPGTNPAGDAVDITPKVWVTANKNGQQRPTTVSFENQCGRVLFSTYHTESGFGGSTTLLAQEKALLYVLLEVGVCLGERPGVR